MKSTMMKTTKYSLILLLIVSMAGCDGFLDVNDDPNAATEAPGDLLFVEAAVSLQSNRNIELGPPTSFFAQTWASNGTAAVFLNPDRYVIGSSNFTVTNSWGAFYPNVLNNLELFINDAKENEPVRNNAIAQASLLQAYTYYTLTVLWGDVPFSEALREDIQNPIFDTQEDVLRGILTQIDEALALINPGETAPAITEGDLFYGGNVEQWRMFGNSLKLRVLMLLYNQDQSVASEIQTLINNPDLIRENANNFEFPYTTSNGNENQVYQLHADFNSGNPGFIYASKTVVDLMNVHNDPRLATYFDEAPLLDDNGDEIGTQGYIGRENGASFGTEYSQVGANIIRPNFPGRILTASETLLHEAEFLAQNGDTGAARDKLQAGLEASIDYFDGLPGAISDADRDAFVTAVLAEFNAGSTGDKVRILQEQHFIDVFEKCPENWTLWRRTKTPELQLPQNAQLGALIRRLPYPSTEASSNPNIPDPMPTRDEPMWFEQ
ncbi:MAG: SusD/RagB family nutrient-binding outer membrane lipoprotein [Bacteroidetes bacterium]|jgi:hypothetical protein|nr:SusD/RagB family nutrient-binding outer membrane lipoprotein [Bacteroidota bacterium]